MLQGIAEDRDRGDNADTLAIVGRTGCLRGVNGDGHDPVEEEVD